MALLKGIAMLSLRRRAVIGAVAVLLLLFSASARATTDGLGLDEEKIKAGLLYNFLKYTQWPGNGRETMNICLFQEDPFGGLLDPLKGRTAQQSRIDVTTVADVQGLNGCTLVYVPAEAQGSISAVVSYARSKSILTISDIRGFARRGGMVEFATGSDQHIHIFINKAATQAADIKIGARLERLAEMVGE